MAAKFISYRAPRTLLVQAVRAPLKVGERGTVVVCPAETAMPVPWAQVVGEGKVPEDSSAM